MDPSDIEHEQDAHSTSSLETREAEPSTPKYARGELGAWWREGFRTALFMRSNWDGLRATPAIVACLIAVPYALAILMERLYIVSDAQFFWPAFQVAWLSTAVTAWVCWSLGEPTASTGAAQTRPSASALFAMITAQVLTPVVILSLIFVPLARSGAVGSMAQSSLGRWLLWSLPLVWLIAAPTKLVWQSTGRSKSMRCGAVTLMGALLVLGQVSRPVTFWYPIAAPADDQASGPLVITQELLEAQAALLPKALDDLKPERPGVVDAYSIVYSPYAEEDVFRRESAMVTSVMEQRFGSGGRDIQLVNHRDTVQMLPWATPANLRRSIQAMATKMNPDEDILFLYLTSHGAHDGVLSTSLQPLTIEPLTPALLKTWLDEAGVRYAVISVSACFSGSWIAPFASDTTLVMTAADADHTSFGCGRKSELTFFGRAMFNEGLRRTRSFEDAHAAARISIDQRERAAGKSDGYSNPQIRMGSAMRERLAKLSVDHLSDN